VPGLNASVVCCAGRQPESRSQRATPTVRSEKRWPAEQVHAQPVEKETVRRRPTYGFKHGKSPRDKIRRPRRLRQSHKCGGQCHGLPAETSDPLLAALVGHPAVAGSRGRFLQRLMIEQPRFKKQSDDCNRVAQVRQQKLRQ
jgi:hypothetical protein